MAGRWIIQALPILICIATMITTRRWLDQIRLCTTLNDQIGMAG